VIARIVALYGLPVYSTMVKFIEQQKWSELGHVTFIGVNEVKDFHTVRYDENYDAKSDDDPPPNVQGLLDVIHAEV
jgi:hypothetical protein